MTVDAVLDRGLARGRSIWPVFQHQIPGLLAVQVSDRAIVFGIYSGAYLHGYGYLRDVTYEQLAQMLLSYNQSMSELTADEQKAVIDIAAKRYIEDQNLAAKDAALANKARKVDVKTQEVDAKEAALESDREALLTKITELEVVRAKISTRIVELQSQIGEQEYDSAQVEAEITRQELIAQKAQLDVVETGIRALEIQSQISDAAYRLAMVDVKKIELESDISRIEYDTVEVDVRAAQTEADISKLETQTAYESLTESELTVAQAETIAYRQETVLRGAKAPLIEQRIVAAEEEINVTIPTLERVVRDERNADSANQSMRNAHTVKEYENRTLVSETRSATSNTMTELELSSHHAEATQITDNAMSREAVHRARIAAQADGFSGALYAARVMMEANIVNTMTHSIGVAK